MADHATLGRSAAAQAVIEYILARDTVTFVEIGRVLAPFIPTVGECELNFEHLPNLVLWAGMSDEWCDVMREVQASKLVDMDATSVWAYLYEGQALKMPIAKRPPQGGYKTAHWAPVCFRPKRRTP